MSVFSRLAELLSAFRKPAWLPQIATTESLQLKHVASLVLFVLVTGNIGFYHQITAIYPLNMQNLGFLLSLPVLIGALTMLLYSLFSLVVGARIAAILIVLATCPAAYFIDHFGIVMDYTMLDNMLQSDAAEIKGLVSTSLLIWTFCLGIIPMIVILKLPTIPISRLHEWRRSVTLGVVLLAMAIAPIVMFSVHYASFFREHKATRYYVNPVNPVFAVSKYAATQLDRMNEAPLQPILTDAEPSLTNSRKLVIMVVGETARSDRFALNGYERDTNPRLAKEAGLVSYANVQSCGTSTAISVPCMFSGVGHNFMPGEGTEFYRGVGAIVLFGILGAAVVSLTMLPALTVSVLSWLENRNNRTKQAIAE